MFFTASKVFWLIAEPGNLLAILLGLGVIAMLFRWRRLARFCIGFVIVAVIVITVFPIGNHLVFSLEKRFPPVKNLPETIEGIIVLGGFSNQFVTRAKGQVALNGAAERLFEMARLAKRYPNAKLIVTGGSGHLFRQGVKEADTLEPMFEVLGLQKTRITLENRSRNTHENARFTRVLLKPTPGQNWVLITSAFHMPRAVGCFRKTGWSVIPYPVDYNIIGTWDLEPGFNFTGGLSSLGKGLHEWIGLAAYRLMGRTDTFIPGPGKP